MKRILLFTMMAVATMAATAQEATVNVDTIRLENAFTEEQKSTLTKLTVTGTMSAEDYRFIREDNLVNMEVLNLRDATIDSIPRKAFYNWKSKNAYKGVLIVLPKEISHIGDSAFANRNMMLAFEVTGNFPTQGNHILAFDASNLYLLANWLVAPDNTVLRTINDDGGYKHICSLDSTVLYKSDEIYEHHATIPEGVKIIAAHAYEDMMVVSIIMPESLDYIGDYAFNTLKSTPVPTCCVSYDEPYMICMAKTPPRLGYKALNFQNQFEFYPLFVPDESLDLYRNNKEWSEAFTTFYGSVMIYPVSEFNESNFRDIDEVAMKNTIVSYNGSNINIQSPDAERVVIYTTDGKKVGKAKFTDSAATIGVSKQQATYIYVVTYRNGGSLTGKLFVK